MSPLPRDAVVERVVGRTLAVASTLAAAVLVAGVGAWLIAGAPTPAVRREVMAWPGLGGIGLIGAGLLVVTFTPLVVLAAAFAAFVRMGERREAWATAAVLAVLVGSVVGAALIVGTGG